MEDYVTFTKITKIAKLPKLQKLQKLHYSFSFQFISTMSDNTNQMTALTNALLQLERMKNENYKLEKTNKAIFHQQKKLEEKLKEVKQTKTDKINKLYTTLREQLEMIKKLEKDVAELQQKLTPKDATDNSNNVCGTSTSTNKKQKRKRKLPQQKETLTHQPQKKKIKTTRIDINLNNAFIYMNNPQI